VRYGLAGVCEVLTRIEQRLKNESPFAHTLMLTLCNGYSGYLPDDDAYQQISYEIATSHVKRGCAESGIIDGLMDMMDQE
jgi:neutral ceramidase